MTIQQRKDSVKMANICSCNNFSKDVFPDGTAIDSWFSAFDSQDFVIVGKKFKVTDYEIYDDGKCYTEKFQRLIEFVFESGGGTIVVPKGVFITGALFFKQGVDLYIEKGGTIKGSDDVSEYKIMQTRIEGETCLYYSALINVDNVDGFKMFGEGTIDGNGERSWKAFWNRRKWNGNCTNKDEQRARLVYISNSKNVLVQGLTLQNSQFWTNHLYKSKRVAFVGCKILSPKKPTPAPSTDAIDVDACTDVLIKNCYIAVNDDAVALKGGKGTWADKDINNGSNERIIVEDCRFGFCHGCLTCGSESLHNKNIMIRNIKVDNAINLMWFKLRPDTPQIYELIEFENVQGTIINFININPWTQFFDIKNREDMPISRVDKIIAKNINCVCKTFFNVKLDDNYALSNFYFSNLTIKAEDSQYNKEFVRNFVIDNVKIKEE